MRQEEKVQNKDKFSGFILEISVRQIPNCDRLLPERDVMPIIYLFIYFYIPIYDISLLQTI